MCRRFLHIFPGVMLVLLLSMCIVGCGSSRGGMRAAVAHTQNNGRKPQPEIKHIPIDKHQMHAATISLLREADTWLGVPYKYGGTDRSGVDCSAMVMNVFDSSLKIKVPRNSRKQYAFCTPVERCTIIPGDLLFFSTPTSDEIGHVGIYIGDDRMIHASSSRGVVISDVNSDYFLSHYKGSGRIDSYYAMIDSRRDAIPADPSPVPQQLIADNTLAVRQSEVSAVSTPVKEIPLSVFVAINKPEAESEKASAEQPEVQTIKTVDPAYARVTAAISEEEARRQVLSSYSEQPADSVLTPFFD